MPCNTPNDTFTSLEISSPSVQKTTAAGADQRDLGIMVGKVAYYQMRLWVVARSLISQTFGSSAVGCTVSPINAEYPLQCWVEQVLLSTRGTVKYGAGSCRSLRTQATGTVQTR